MSMQATHFIQFFFQHLFDFYSQYYELYTHTEPLWVSWKNMIQGNK